MSPEKEIETVCDNTQSHNPWSVKVRGVPLMTKQGHVRRWKNQGNALAAGRQHLKENQPQTVATV